MRYRSPGPSEFPIPIAILSRHNYRYDYHDKARASRRRSIQQRRSIYALARTAAIPEKLKRDIEQTLVG